MKYPMVPLCQNKSPTRKAVNGSAEKQKPQKIGQLKSFAKRKLKPSYPRTVKCVCGGWICYKNQGDSGVSWWYVWCFARYGHVRDLAARSGSVRPDDDFSLLWEIPSASWTHLSSINVALSWYKSVSLSLLTLNGAGCWDIEYIVRQSCTFDHPRLWLGKNRSHSIAMGLLSGKSVSGSGQAKSKPKVKEAVEARQSGVGK